MDVAKGNWKRNIFVKAWERCRSVGTTGSKKYYSDNNSLRRSQTWQHYTTKTTDEEGKNDRGRKKCQVAPEGCFSVYVGPEKQRFVVKAKFANHPLFKLLLEDAELEYGYNSEGPLLLPCGVDLFYRVLAEIDSGDNRSKEIGTAPIWSPLSILCSPRRPNNCGMNKAYDAYRPLTPSRMLKLNKYNSY